MFPCSDCDLLNANRCRITNQVRAVDAMCSLTTRQQLGIWMQAKRLVAADAANREVIITSVGSHVPGCNHIRFEGTVDGQPQSREIHKDRIKELLAEQTPREQVIMLLAEVISATGANTSAEIIAAVEGSVIYLGSD